MKIFEEIQRKNKEYNKPIHKKIIDTSDYNQSLINELLEIILKDRSDLSYEKILELQNNLLDKENFAFPLRKLIYYNNSENTFSNNDITLNPDFEIKTNKLILNEKTKYQNFYKELKNELICCSEFYFMISFIRMSGLQLLLSEFKQLEDRGIKGKIITSTYLNITEAKALKKLLQFKNIEVKIYDSSKESFHTKAYIFKRNSQHTSTCIIGSSNLSHSALHTGNEWNIKLYDAPFLNIYNKAEEEFFKVWTSHKTENLTLSLINSYEEFCSRYKNEIKSFNYKDIKKNNKIVEPNIMQEKILKNLKSMRKKECKKAIVIAATGTGKTYLSAFDIKNFSPKKVLFIAHREELLDNAIKTFKNLLGENDYGKLTMNFKKYKSKYLFATIQSLVKLINTNIYLKNEFDYIIIDEFHHAAAESYRKILNFFDPKFLLGLTATPERADGKDILELCDYNIAGEIRLKEALEKELLVPFHYFGINDDTVNYDIIPTKNGLYIENELIKKLNINKRVNFIINKIKLYDYDGKILKALGFCINKEHAKFMSHEFNKKGYRTDYIIADHNFKKRQNIIDKFSSGEIEIIFCIDIFNEGIDLPDINMLLFLRPTESATVFIQQLGRGLRKSKNKEYVTVLDFIGNHNKAFLIPVAFASNSGEISNFDIRILKKEIKNQFSDSSANSYIELDRICQKRILNKLENLKLNSTSYLKEAYENLRNKFDRPLKYSDFIFEKEIKIEQFIKKYKSFLRLKKIMNDLTSFEKELADDYEKNFFIEKIENFLPLKWSYHFLILKICITSDDINLISRDQIFKIMNDLYPSSVNNSIFHKNLLKNAMKELDEDDFGKYEILKNNHIFTLNKNLKKLFTDIKFKKYILNLINFGLKKYEYDFLESDLNINKCLIKYKEYSRAELQYLLQSKAQKGSWRAGYSIAEKNICLFITMNKDKYIPEHLNYDNFFYKHEIVQWISQNKTSHSSPIGTLFVEHKKMNYKVHIFVRKYSNFNGDTMQFIYLGEADYYSSHGDKPMFIKWKLHKKIPNNIYLEFLE